MFRITSCLVAATLFAAPCFAQDIAISVSPKLQEDLEDKYGIRELDRLKAKLEKSVRTSLEKNEISAERVEIVIERATPNHPTMYQTTRDPGLDMFRSVSLGGAELSGKAYDANNQLIAEAYTKRYARDIYDAQFGTTWTDAQRAFSSFATKLAKNAKS